MGAYAAWRYETDQLQLLKEFPVHEHLLGKYVHEGGLNGKLGAPVAHWTVLDLPPTKGTIQPFQGGAIAASHFGVFVIPRMPLEKWLKCDLGFPISDDYPATVRDFAGEHYQGWQWLERGAHAKPRIRQQNFERGRACWFHYANEDLVAVFAT